MSFLKRLFGGGAPAEAGGEEPQAAGKEVEHNGFMIRATPFKAEGQFQCCGVVTKEVVGLLKDHQFFRPVRSAPLLAAAVFALRKRR